MELIVQAQKYIDAGFSIIPVNLYEKNGRVLKVSALKTWKKYQEEKVSTPNIFKNYFNKGSGIAIVTGEISNLLVLDIDKQESYENIKKFLIPTYTVRTPGGGYHFYFKYREGLNTVAGLDQIGLDIRANGGYVVAPPSEYPDGTPYYIENDSPVARMPEPLFSHLLALRKQPKKNGKTKETWFDKAILGVGKGKRNDTAIKLAGYFLHYKIPVDHIKLLLKEWNQKNDPPMGGEELDTLLETFLTKEREDIIGELNEKHAVVRIGNSVAILETFVNDVNEHDFRLLKQTDFSLLYKNRTVSINRRAVPVSEIWIGSSDRKEYQGIIFDPKNDSEDYYNLWNGFARQPKKGKWDLYREHIEQVIAPGNSEWLLAWMARIIQDPGGERPGTVPVLRGVQGTGKSLFANIFGEIFGRHFATISSIKGITRQFTHYLKDNIFLFLDEGLWGGDKQSSGILKSIVTEPWRMTEPKGFEAFRIKNHINLMIASNEEWIVPGGMGERRFLVLDVAEKRKHDYTYFQQMAKEMYLEGGIEAMMHDLLNMDISNINLRKIPETEGTCDQIVRSLTIVEAFWLDRLERCSLVDSHDYWKNVVASQKLYDQYLDFCKERYGQRGILQSSQFGACIKKLCPGLENLRKRAGIRNEGRFRAYGVPTLIECRDSFDKAMGSSHRWPEICELNPPHDEEERFKDFPGSHRPTPVF